MSANQHLDKQINGNRTNRTNMKIAKIIPIYKSKEKNNMGNYRPISFYHQSRKFWKKLLIKDHMAFVKLSIFFMIINTDVGRNIPLKMLFLNVLLMSCHLLKTTSTHLQYYLQCIWHNRSYFLKKAKFVWYSWYCLGVVQKLFYKPVSISWYFIQRICTMLWLQSSLEIDKFCKLEIQSF